MVKLGKPLPRCASTCTSGASSPSCARLRARARLTPVPARRRGAQAPLYAARAARESELKQTSHLSRPGAALLKRRYTLLELRQSGARALDHMHLLLEL